MPVLGLAGVPGRKPEHAILHLRFMLLSQLYHIIPSVCSQALKKSNSCHDFVAVTSDHLHAFYRLNSLRT